MFSKIVALCGLMAVCQAAFLPAPAHYSSAAAVSSQSIVRHGQTETRIAVTAPVAVNYRATPVTYNAAPVSYSSAAAVSSQNILRHDQYAARVAPATTTYRAAPAAVTYGAIPAAISYRAAPVAYRAGPAVVARAEPFNAHPRYDYNYSVADSHTGDIKSQQESRDGDVVRGSYSLHEADGSVRTVEYSADAHSGFNAVVHNTAASVRVNPIPAHGAQYYHH